jgi:hypothetical protein
MTTTSQWQLRYPSASEGLDDDISLNEWIAEVQRRADADEFYELTQHPTDNDVADIIAQMELILNNSVNSNTSFNFDDYGLDEELSSNHSLVTGSDDDIIDIDLLRNKSNERVKKMCFDELRKHSRSEKKRLGWIEKLSAKQNKQKLLRKYILKWVAVNRILRVREVILAFKFGRTSVSFRRTFVEWKRLMMIRREQLSKVDCRLKRMRCRRVFSTFLQNKVMLSLAMETAREKFSIQRKAKVISSWRAMVRRQITLTKKAKQFQRGKTRVCFVAWSSERNDSQDETPTIDEKKELAKTKQKPTSSEDDELLKPLKKPSRRSSWSYSTTRIVADMNQRNENRLRQREMIRSRKEKVAVANKHLREVERHRHEERELQVYNEFLRMKSDEKERKERDAMRSKEAYRLAVLHYKLSLQKRFFAKWKRIFVINQWNDRKAGLFLRDVTYEKFYYSWKEFNKSKALRLLKRQHLAFDFHETALLAKVFAFFEENLKFRRYLQDEATTRLSMNRKRAVLRAWHRKTLERMVIRDAKELEARQLSQILLLRRVIQNWKIGVEATREEERIEKLIEEKYAAMMQWLEASRQEKQ